MYMRLARPPTCRHLCRHLQRHSGHAKKGPVARFLSVKRGDVSMSKAHVIHQLGAPSAMQWMEWEVPDPAPGEVRLRHTAVGVNYADTLLCYL